MFDRLAHFVQERRRLVAIGAVVFFMLAGALGGSVADRLDPYGAEDPATETSLATERLQDAGYRSTGVVVLIEDVDVASAAGRQRVEELEAKVAGDPDVESVTGFLNTRSDAFVSHDGDATYLAVALSPTDDAEVQDAGERIEELLADEEGVSGRAVRRRPGAGERAGREGPAHRRAAAPSPFSSCCRCCSSAAWSRRRCRCSSAASRSSAPS